MQFSKLHFFIIPTLLTLLFSSCKPEDEHPIPDIYINFSINIENDPEYFFMQTQGGTVIIKSYDIGLLSLGYNDNGVIIYNAGFNEFYAFDCTCPYDLPNNVALQISDMNGVASCPVCGSEYVFTSVGAPTIQSLANWPLKKYDAFFNPNTGQLTVTN